MMAQFQKEITIGIQKAKLKLKLKLLIKFQY